MSENFNVSIGGNTPPTGDALREEDLSEAIKAPLPEMESLADALADREEATSAIEQSPQHAAPVATKEPPPVLVPPVEPQAHYAALPEMPSEPELPPFEVPSDASVDWAAVCGVAHRGLADFYRLVLADAGIASRLRADGAGHVLVEVAEARVDLARAVLESAGETWFFEDAPEEDPGQPEMEEEVPVAQAAPPDTRPSPPDLRSSAQRALSDRFPSDHPARTGLPPIPTPRVTSPGLRCPECGSDRVIGTRPKCGKIGLFPLLVLGIIACVLLARAVGGISWLFLLIIIVTVIGSRRAKQRKSPKYFCRTCRHTW